MAKKDRRRKPKPPAPIKWEFDPDIPTDDWFEGDDPFDDLGELIDNFIFKMEQGDFHKWEAVIAEEQGLRLTKSQRKSLNALISFDDSNEVLYIDEIARPSEPWYEILRKIVPPLLEEPFDTTASHFLETSEGWPRLEACLDEHAEGLSLPEGVSTPMEIIPVDLRHKLWLQSCLDELSGIDHDPEWIDFFVGDLKACKESVEYLDLTIESLLTRVILPESDVPRIVQALKTKLGIESEKDRIAEHL